MLTSYFSRLGFTVSFIVSLSQGLVSSFCWMDEMGFHTKWATAAAKKKKNSYRGGQHTSLRQSDITGLLCSVPPFNHYIHTLSLSLCLSLTIWQRHPKKKAEKEEKGEGQGEPHQVHMQQFIKELKAVQERKRKTHERKHPHCFFCHWFCGVYGF